MLTRALLAFGVAACLASAAAAQSSFVNFETPHVSPMTITPDGTRLLAVNTADNRLEVFAITPAGLRHAGSVAVGLDPVSVRARNDAEAWVVNHISDSVSIVDLAAMNVVRTINTDDEPADVVFAGSPVRAFVSCSQANTILVFDPANPAAAPQRIAIVGEDPRAMAVSADGTRVFVAIFEGGNATTILGGGLTIVGGFPPNVVSDPAGPYGGVNPPPNIGGVGGTFDPPINVDLPPPPAVGLIVRRNAAGQWMDDNGQDWTIFVSGPQAALSGRPVGWNLVDHDLAIIDTATLGVTYAGGIVNIAMALAVHPTDGQVTLVGTDAMNQIRFEPVVNGTFLRVLLGRYAPDNAAAPAGFDFNPHLDYSTPTIDQPERNRSLADPRGIVWTSDGLKGYVSGMGSNNVKPVGPGADLSGDPIPVGEGPTGLALHEDTGRLFVLNKFAATISTIDTASDTVIATTPLFDPTPEVIRVGRKHLYDAHKNSGLGHVACASCHVDARYDALAWDLGDPLAEIKPVTGQNCQNGLVGGCEDFHPMKGPMTTQTLQDIVGKEPFHWRGDRDGLEEFRGAFMLLQGDDETPTLDEMQEFEDFLAAIHFPPNPYRTINNTLPTSLPLTGHFTTGRFAAAGSTLPNGNATTGLNRYRTGGLDGGVDCVSCHTIPTGIGSNHLVTSLFPPVSAPIAPGPNGELHHALVSVDGSTNISIKVPQIRGIYEKTGFDLTQLVSTRGFGFLHDGSVDSIARFVSEPVFSVTSDQEVANLVALMLAFSGSELPLGSATDITELPGPLSKDAHAAVGEQITVDATNRASAGVISLLNTFQTLANANKIGFVAKGVQGGIVRGYRYAGGGVMQSDRAGETISVSNLRLAAAAGAEITFTAVPFGSQQRIGVDRDEDGWLDRDEVEACSDPANAASTPANAAVDGDADHDGAVTLADYAALEACLAGPGGGAGGVCACEFDLDQDGDVDLRDAAVFQALFDVN
jgi:YVTN family beta-propeller protein